MRFLDWIDKPRGLGMLLAIIGFMYGPVMKIAAASELFPSLRGRYSTPMEELLKMSLLAAAGFGALGWFAGFCLQRVRDSLKVSTRE
jgi:hypothetical protein